MPTHPEMQLLSRIVRTGCMAEVVEWGIGARDFKTARGVALWNNAYSFFQMEKNSVPGLNTIQTVQPDFDYCDDPNMGTDALCSLVRRNRIQVEAKEYLEAAQEEIDLDPMKALAEVSDRLSTLVELGTRRNTDVCFAQGAQEILEDYRVSKAGICPTGLTWPWRPLYEETSIEGGEYVIFYGRPKSKKTWVLSYLISFFYAALQKKVLVYTKEMTPKNILRRVYACIAEVDYKKLRTGQLGTSKEDIMLSIYDAAQRIGVRDNLWCLSGADVAEGGDTVPWLQAKIEKYKPDIVFVDGIYLMSTPKRVRSDHERVQSISRDCRQMAMHTQVPVIAATQANRKAAGHNQANLDEIAHSDALAQDATLAIRVINECTTPGKETVLLAVAGSREFALDGFRINAQCAEDFTFHSMVTTQELEKAKEQDVPKDELAKKPNGKSPKRATKSASSEDALLAEQLKRIKRADESRGSKTNSGRTPRTR